MLSQRGYGWRPQKPDWRDHPMPMVMAPSHILPRTDLRPLDTPILDQGQTSSCTGHAAVGIFQFVRKKEGLPFVPLAPLFPYYNGRVIEGTTDQDAGAEIRDVIKAAAKQGVCPFDDLPTSPENVTVKPSDKAYADALKDLAPQYYAVHQTMIGIRTCLSLGYPIELGFTVYESFESDAVAQTGMMPMPGKDEQVVGGHAIDFMGHDDDQRKFICRNSWSPQWGDKGYFYMPYDYALNGGLASDFWMVQRTTQ